MEKVKDLRKAKNLLREDVLAKKEYFEIKKEQLLKLKKDNTTDAKNNVPKDENGILTINFGGKWSLFDVKTNIFIDNILYSSESTKKGFSVEIPIASSKMQLKTTLGSSKSTVYELAELNKSKNYSLSLIYDIALGKYRDKFYMIGND